MALHDLVGDARDVRRTWSASTRTLSVTPASAAAVRDVRRQSGAGRVVHRHSFSASRDRVKGRARATVAGGSDATSWRPCARRPPCTGWTMGAPRSGNGTSTWSKSRGTSTRREHGLGLGADLARREAAGEVRQHQQADVGLAGERRRLAGGGVRASRAPDRAPRRGRWPRAPARRAAGGLERGVAGLGVARDHDRAAAGAASPSTSSGAHRAPRAGDRPRRRAAARRSRGPGRRRARGRRRRRTRRGGRPPPGRSPTEGTEWRVGNGARCEALAAPGGGHLALVELLELQREGQCAR